ncbi:PepSY-associated TM helix domain-containing protein [Lysobacter enzymogenes]|uniref:PepSY-associated TM helix domain-containing protein n=1 Tax=Lysobacter enzymogenes TaxID=69 RepID=UPI0008971B41|nr:PepSY-associated TM helix domain-containing protein [Lysobacter enzymogenes]SDX39872.1 Uncharacterized iron-regulated membrane protein [Lysobacter enzymogenes]
MSAKPAPAKPGSRGGTAGLLASHSWLGLIASWVLFLVFLAGAMTMFKREVDLWEKAPHYLGSHSRAVAGLDGVLAATQVPREVADPHIEVILPGRMSAYYQVFLYDDAGDFYRATAFHPVTGAQLPDPEATGLGEFFEEFHKELYLPGGHYLVGVASLLMFLGLLTGLVLHWPKLSLSALFAPRWGKPRLRWLDLHNSLGVLALPFHLLMAFTGTVFSLTLLLQVLMVFGRLQGDEQPLRELLFAPPLPIESAHAPAPARSIDALIRAASLQWDMEPVRVSILHYGDRNAWLTVHGHGHGSLAQVGQASYRLDTGEPLRTLPPHAINALAHGNEVLHRLHYGDFGGFGLRLIYFLLAIATCVLIATGNLLWLEKRLSQRVRPRGLRWVAGLSVGACGGGMLALATVMLAARTLPVDVSARMDWVIGAFAAPLLAACALGVCSARPRRDLIVLLGIAGALFLLLPLLDWALMGRALRAALVAGDAAPMVTIELLCLALAVASLGTVRWLRRDPIRAATLSRPAAAAPGSG